MNIRKSFILIALVVPLFLAFSFQNSSKHKVLFEKAKFTMETKGDLNTAIKLFGEIIEKYPYEKEYAAKSQLYIGFCYEKLGLKKAQEAFQKVIDNYPEQAELVKIANEKLSVLMRAQSVLEKGDREFKIRKIWEGADVDTYGEISPDGKYLSFTDMSTGDLAIREIATGKNRHLTNKGSWATTEFALNSRWSPDGRSLAYGWWNKDNFVELRVTEIDDAEPRVLSKDKDLSIIPSDWSPDGKYILAHFIKENKTFQIGLVEVSDGTLRILQTLKEWAGDPVFSPDSRSIIYDNPQTKDSPERDIFLIPIEKGEVTPLIKHPADDWILGWAPDGKHLFFASDRTGSKDAWIVQVTDGKLRGDPHLVKNDIGQISPMGFTKQGSFCFNLETSMVDVYMAKIDLEKGEILASPEKITGRFVGSNYAPDWSSDGKYLAFISERKPETGGTRSQVICIRSNQTGEVREISPQLDHFGRLRWHPDSRSIFVTGSTKTVVLGLYKIDSETGQTALLAESETGANIKDFAFSIDGRFVFYAYFEWTKKLARIIRRDLKTGKEDEIYRKDAPPDLGILRVSPDGQQLSFTTAELGAEAHILRVIPTSGGEARDILRRKSKNWLPHDWAPDGKGIFFFEQLPGKKDETYELWRLPAEGGEPQKIGLEMENMRSLRIHPDGKQIAFIAGKTGHEIWIMENFLKDFH